VGCGWGWWFGGVCVCVCVCVCTIFISFQCLVLCALNNVNMHEIYRASAGTDSSPEWSIMRIAVQLFRHVSYVISIYCQFLSSKFYF
jgi:glycogen synthase